MSHYDVIVAGGGHNGLVAATYLAQAGKSVLLVEKQEQFGGAAISAVAFPGVEANLSRYSYLVSLFPQKIMSDLGMSVELRRRRFSSYTPVPGGTTGLLIEAQDPAATRASFSSVGAEADYDRWVEFYAMTQSLAEAVFPQMVEPLLTREEMRRRVIDHTGSDKAWHHLIETPIDQTIDEWFSSDLVKGVVLTDGLIGTFPDGPGDASVSTCFVYHVIGGGTGDWDVPVGGMGQVTGSLTKKAKEAGVVLQSSAEVTAITPDGEVWWRNDHTEHTDQAEIVIAGFSPTELSRLVSGSSDPAPAEGAQVKVNLVVSRLPKLRDTSVDPPSAFGGTFHINETWSGLHDAARQAIAGDIPDPIPAEIYCHSLTDPSILGQGLRASGTQTLTVFDLHVPHRLIADKPADEIRRELQDKVLASLDSVLAEPIHDLILRTPDGQLCVETKTTKDLEDTLRLPGGNIFHGPLSWPFVESGDALSSPADRWGVATDNPRILIGGAGARRGGGVSGLGGHNAAMAALEMLGDS
jgi:phytoene dehydrogenase-like protein